MSKAEEMATNAGYRGDIHNRAEYISNDVRSAYIEGYEQAEKDLALNPTDILKAIRESSIFQEHIFMNGGCYQLYLILKAIFPEAKPYITGYPGCAHIATLINGKLYDIGGCYNSMIDFIPLSAEIEEEAREWRFEAMNELYYGECDVCGEPIKIDRSLIGKPIMARPTLTPESIKKIVSIADDMIKEGENCGFNPPEWYGTESFYDEVLRRFNDED